MAPYQLVGIVGYRGRESAGHTASLPREIRYRQVRYLKTNDKTNDSISWYFQLRMMKMDHMKIRVYETTCPPRPDADAIEPIQEGTLTIKPVFESGDSFFGAEIYGVDWSKPVPPELVAQVSLYNYVFIDETAGS